MKTKHLKNPGVAKALSVIHSHHKSIKKYINTHASILSLALSLALRIFIKTAIISLHQ